MILERRTRTAYLSILAMIVFQSSYVVSAQSQVVAPPAIDGALVKLARSVEPDLVGDISRLPVYIEFFKSKLANDTRLFAFQVNPRFSEAGIVELEGHVEFSQTRDGLIGFLKALGFEVSDKNLQNLPSVELGSKRFGLVKTTHTLSYSGPQKPQSVVTDCLLGEPLYLLREERGYLLAHSAEGYLGYVSAGDVYRVDAKKFALYPTAKAIRMVEDYTLPSGMVVPAGAVLKQLPSDEEKVVCALPTGEVVEIPRKKCRSTKQPTEAIEQAIGVGKRLLETPYHWGGKTSKGIDCSGLVQVAFSTCGYRLPRDSNQQFLLGRLTATRWHRAGLRRGDTLYFLGKNGRIRHTALYLGGDRYLQAEMPAVNIRSLNPNHEDYDERRDKSFAFGKRLWQ